MDSSYPQSVAALKAELGRLETELRAADAAGNRRLALNTLARMLQLQKRFMNQWSRRSESEDHRPDAGPIRPGERGHG